MAEKKEKVRLSISLDKDLNDRIEILSNRMSMSKASLCNAIISQGIQSYEMAWKLMSDPNAMLQIASTLGVNSIDALNVNKEIIRIENEENKNNEQ